MVGCKQMHHHHEEKGNEDNGKHAAQYVGADVIATVGTGHRYVFLGLLGQSVSEHPCGDRQRNSGYHQQRQHLGKELVNSSGLKINLTGHANRVA